jgi:hypothetical protein
MSAVPTGNFRFRTPVRVCVAKQPALSMLGPMIQLHA